MDQRVVRMRNPKRAGQSVYFYDGSLKADANGLIEVPAGKKHWAQRVWILGFRLNADGTRCCLNVKKHMAHELGDEPAKQIAHQPARVDVKHTDSEDCACLVPAAPESIEHNPVAEDFVHIDSTDCLCFAPVVTEEEAAARLAADAPADEAETAESGEETADDEAADVGGLPAGDDGIRPSAEDRPESLPDEGLDSGDGDGPAVLGDRD